MPNKKNSQIAVVIGTKAEFIKCMPIMVELQRQKKDYIFIHTGQHGLKDACEVFGIKKPDFVLSKAPKKSTKFFSKINRNSFVWFFGMIFKIKKTLNKTNPNYVIYHGDTMSTGAAAIASSWLLNPKKEWKGVHLEAGLRSGSFFEPFPEEISRRISDKFSDILLAVSDRTENNLRKEIGSKKKIIKSGNTILDAVDMAYKQAKKSKIKKIKERYVLINIHRHENLRSKKRMKKIIAIIQSVGIKSIWPLHDNTQHFLEKYGLMEKIKKDKNIEIRPLTSYQEFIFLTSNADYLITDGGSIQEESLVFGKPCIILRKRTERQEGLESGINFLTNLDITRTKNIIKEIESGRVKVKRFENPYGKKGLSKKIVKILE